MGTQGHGERAGGPASRPAWLREGTAPHAWSIRLWADGNRGRGLWLAQPVGNWSWKSSISNTLCIRSTAAFSWGEERVPHPRSSPALQVFESISSRPTPVSCLLWDRSLLDVPGEQTWPGETALDCPMEWMLVSFKPLCIDKSFGGLPSHWEVSRTFCTLGARGKVKHRPLHGPCGSQHRTLGARLPLMGGEQGSSRAPPRLLQAQSFHPHPKVCF